MRAQNIWVNVEEITWLWEHLRNAQSRHEQGSAHLKALREALDGAAVVLPNQMPPDVVTMQSHVLLRDLASNEEMECVLVFPDDADALMGRISVVAPIGTAILGRRAGDVIQVKLPAGVRKMRIERILHQPEATAMASREACV